VLDAAAILGSALQEGPLRIGGEVDGRFRVERSGLDVGLGLAYSASAHRVHGVEASWLEAFAGLAFERSFIGPLDAAVHAEALLERLGVDAGSGASPESGSRVLGGVRIGADFRCWATPAFGVFAGASGRWVAGTTDVRVGGFDAVSAPPFGFVVRAGLSAGFR
jgi:hypothetical protein